MIKVEVVGEIKCGMEQYVVYVNGTYMCERPNPRYANTKAQAFADRLKADGHNVSLALANSIRKVA